MKPKIPEKIRQIKEYVEKHPGCTTYEIIKALGESYGQLVYYAAYSGLVKAVKDDRFKRANLYFPADYEAPACQITPKMVEPDPKIVRRFG